MKGGKTDWDSYYSKPYRTARVTRKITAHVLIKNISKYNKKHGSLTIAELGGANSCFFEVINKKVHPEKYYIIDNNKLGLEKFRERIREEKRTHCIETDVLKMKMRLKADIVFSVGLIEHFSKKETAKVITSHFDLLKKGGIAVILFPTPTFLYRITRFFAEILNLWIFHDERPLKMKEVLDTVSKYGMVLHTSIIRPIFLTQGLVVVKKI